MLYLLYFSTYSGMKTHLLILNIIMLRAQYLVMSLATVIIMWMFIKPLIFYFTVCLSLFVYTRSHSKYLWLMGVTTEYRANLVSLFVCFPHVCLLVKMVSTTVTRSIQLLIKVSTSGKGIRWENPSKDWSTGNRKKKTECFAKFIAMIFQ